MHLRFNIVYRLLYFQLIPQQHSLLHVSALSLSCLQGATRLLDVYRVFGNLYIRT